MTTIRLCMAGLACGLALAGCVTTRPQTSVPAAPMRADDAPEERQPEGWPPYYPPRLVRELAGTDAVTGEAASIERGYVLHRIDLEKVRVLDARATNSAWQAWRHRPAFGKAPLVGSCLSASASWPGWAQRRALPSSSSRRGEHDQNKTSGRIFSTELDGTTAALPPDDGPAQRAAGSA